VNATADGASGFSWMGLSLNTNFYPNYLHPNRPGLGETHGSLIFLAPGAVSAQFSSCDPLSILNHKPCTW